MAIELRLKKSDLSEPWGFRLVGGTDFEAPVVIVKVTENSIAEDVGLQVGDQVVRVKNASTAGLTHNEVHDLISSAGCELELGLIKGAFEDLIMTVRPIAPKEDPVLEKQTDAQIVDPSVPSHQVLKPPQQKKLSTFLQKPKNPKPINHKQVEERKNLGEPYRVKIVKQPKRDPKEKKVVHFQPQVTEFENQTQTLLKEATEATEIVEQKSEETEENVEVEIQTTVKVEEETFVEISEEGSEDIFEDDEEIEEIMRKYEDEDESYPEDKEKISQKQVKINKKEVKEQCVIKIPKPILKVKPMTIGPLPDTSMSLEEQLAAVQKQLLALAQLPSAIQSTLEAVTKQLNEIVELKNSSESSNEEQFTGDQAEYRSDQSEADSDEDGNVNSFSENAEADITENDNDDQQLEELPSEVNEELTTEVQEEVREATPPPPELTEEEKETIRREAELAAKKQKAMEERKKRDWVERPIVLPGGRKWNGPDDTVPKFRNPKMSDEKIDQMIGPFSEVIVGKTKGSVNGNGPGHGATWKSRFTKKLTAILLGRFQSERINFLKYQPPPRNLAYLQNSEVYRLIHGMEPPTKGVGFRSEIVLSEKDYIGDQSTS